jgi:hypothetical protein
MSQLQSDIHKVSVEIIFFDKSLEDTLIKLVSILISQKNLVVEAKRK